MTTRHYRLSDKVPERPIWLKVADRHWCPDDERRLEAHRLCRRSTRELPDEGVVVVQGVAVR